MYQRSISRRFLSTTTVAVAMLMLMGGLSAALAQGSGSKSKQEAPKKEHVKAELNAQALHALINAKLPVVVLDARGESSKIIPGSLALSYDADANAIKKVLPDTNSVIVTYCDGPECPMSQMLADSLAKHGYKNVIRFTGGVETWTQAGFELKTVKADAPASGSDSKKHSGSGSKSSGSGTR